MRDQAASHPSILEEPATGTADDEAALAGRVRNDPHAFAPLYARYLEPIYRYCYRRLGSREAAEDATSQVFCKALAALGSYRNGPFAGWLFSIARNVVADVYRRRRPTEPIEAAGGLRDAAPTPEEALLGTEEAGSLRALLAQLPAGQRSVVELRLAGLSGPEIAVALGRSPGAVKMLQFRAAARLRVLLTAESGSRTPDQEIPTEPRA